MKKTILPLLLLIVCIASATPPEPPVGKRWQIFPELSDEFDGNQLDLSKWNNYHPKWAGRAPAKFKKEAVSVVNGVMQIKNYKLPQAEGNYTIGGGAVTSKNQSAFYGYYEVSAKASEIPMSTTFWMSSYGNYNGPDPCADDRYSLELDIQECVGRHPGQPNSYFTKGMHSNTHYWYTHCDGTKETMSRGNQVEDTRKVYEDFFTYGAWWVDATEVNFYYNNEFGGNVQFRKDVTDNPFDKPQHINMVTETYDWIGAPTDEELADDTKNTSYYDWIRCYTLEDVDESSNSENIIVNGDFETGTQVGWDGWGGNPREIDNTQAYEGAYCFHIGGAGAPEQTLSLKPNTAYTLSAYAKAVKGAVNFGIKNNVTQQHVKDVSVSNNQYQKYTLHFTTQSDNSYKVFFYAPSAGDEGYVDLIEMLEDGSTGGEETVMFPENIWFSEKPSTFTNAASFDFTTAYMANADREMSVELLDGNMSKIGEQVYPAIGGYGKKIIALHLAEKLQEGIVYTARIYIRPKNSENNDNAYQTDQFTFNVTEPAQVKFVVMDARQKTPIAGVNVDLSGTLMPTNANGEAMFTDVDIMTHVVNMDAEGYAPLQNEAYAINRDTTINIELEPRQYRVKVYVRDSLTQAVVKGARITIEGTSKTTDSYGKATFVLPYGENPATVSASKFADGTSKLMVVNDDDLSMLMVKEIADVRFIVKLDDGYLGYCKVTLGDQSKTASALGIASFSDVSVLKPLTYAIEKNDKIWLTETATFYNDTTVNIQLNSTAVDKQQVAQLSIYPNPVKGTVYIQGLSKTQDFTIVSISGVVMAKGKVNSTTPIHVETLNTGRYLILINSGAALSFIKD